MDKATRYSLVLLFDGSQISLDDLRQKAAKVIEKHLPEVDLQVNSIDPKRLQLSIVGSLEDVDACHDKLNAELFDRHSCIRLIDEAGDEIRQQAYPILAQIEQLLRTFINRAMTEVIGFDWWDSMTPPSVRERVLEVEEKSGKRSAIHHPLEFTDFNHLVQIVTGSVQEWPEGRPLTTADLLEVFSDCHSIDKVQAKLEEKVRRISLWDTVFARYFKETDQWNELENSIIGFVIPARNKVMHHRPMRLYELRKLSHTEENIRALLTSAKTELSEEERIEARRIGKDLSDLVRRQQEEMAYVTAEFMRPFDEVAARSAELVRRLGETPEFMRAFDEAAARSTELVRRLGETPEWIRAFDEAVARFAEQYRTIDEAVARLAKPYRTTDEAVARFAELARRLSETPEWIRAIDKAAEQMGAIVEQIRAIDEAAASYAEQQRAIDELEPEEEPDESAD